MDNVKVADDYKDRLFRMIFNDKEKLSMIQFRKEQRKYGNILPHGMELFWKNGIMILTMCM